MMIKKLGYLIFENLKFKGWGICSSPKSGHWHMSQ